MEHETIPLTRGLTAKVDIEDFERLSAISWNACRKNDGNFYARGYLPSLGKTVAMHRLIMSPPANLSIDHINGDRLDNRKSNLRACLHRQNCRNSKKHSNGHSPYKGVRKVHNRWLARIRVDYKLHTLGTFNSEEEAALAYNAAAIKYFGEFARLNIMKEPAQVVTIKVKEQ